MITLTPQDSACVFSDVSDDLLLDFTIEEQRTASSTAINANQHVCIKSKQSIIITQGRAKISQINSAGETVQELTSSYLACDDVAMNTVYLYDLLASRNVQIDLVAAPVSGAKVLDIGTFNVYSVANSMEITLSSKINRDGEVISGSLILLPDSVTAKVVSPDPNVVLYHGLINPEEIDQSSESIQFNPFDFFFVKLVESPSVEQLTEFSAARLVLEIENGNSLIYGVHELTPNLIQGYEGHTVSDIDPHDTGFDTCAEVFTMDYDDVATRQYTTTSLISGNNVLCL